MKMTLNEFKALIVGLRKQNELLNKFTEIGFLFESLQNLFIPYYLLEKKLFSEEQREFLDYWLYDVPKGIKEDPDNKKPFLWDENKKEIPCYTIKQLYEYLKTLDDDGCCFYD